MSSSSTTYFQAPAHALYGHRETGSQQPYPYTSYMTDSPADLNSYTRTDPYDHNHVSSSLTPPAGEFEENLAAFRYADPQLLSPRPTVPSSPHYSWYDWPSEAPAEAFQGYSDQDASQLERYNMSSIQAEIQHSFENQQEFAGTVASPDYSAGYIPQSFETPSAYYYTAHQPVRPEQRSSYSELAPNLAYLNSQTKAPPVRQEPPKIPQDTPLPRRNGAGTSAAPNPYTPGVGIGLALTAFGRKPDPPSPVPVTCPLPMCPLPPPPPPRVPVTNYPIAPPTITNPITTPPPPKASSSKTNKTRSNSTRSISEPRRPSLACTFCRERKIACGRPPDESPDPTCNQCARRSFRCRYLDLKKSRTSKPSKRK